jgi:hypothetical protein
VSSIELTIDTDGLVSAIWDDALADLVQLGECRVERASLVEWDGTGWSADLSPVDGPVLESVPRREDALAAEKDWLKRNWRAQ